MNAIKNALSETIPNLDCFASPKSAEEAAKSFREIAEVMTCLASYCESKSQAMRLRLEGSIDIAIQHESKCDGLYNRLPKWAKW